MRYEILEKYKERVGIRYSSLCIYNNYYHTVMITGSHHNIIIVSGEEYKFTFDTVVSFFLGYVI